MIRDLFLKEGRTPLILNDFVKRGLLQFLLKTFGHCSLVLTVPYILDVQL